MSDPTYHPIAVCRWSGGRFYRIFDKHWRCEHDACYERQKKHAILVEGEVAEGVSPFRYLPTPFGCEVRESRTPNLLGGGAAGGSKSHTARLDLYAWCMAIPNYEALLLRRTFPELESTHLLRMRREADIFGAKYTAVDKTITWPNGSFIKAGHCESPGDMIKYLSTEYDHAVFDEGSTFHPDVVLEISSRCRSSKPEVQARGGAFVRIYSNPGGIGALFLRDHFIDQTPDLERFPDYDVADYGFIRATVYDNPYLDPNYIKRLKQLPPKRQQQLLHGDWSAFDGQFFAAFDPQSHVQERVA